MSARNTLKVAAVAIVLLLLAGTIILAMISSRGGPSPVTGAADQQRKAPGETSIRVQANIDGRSRLYIQGNTVQWLHLEYAAPGRLGGSNKPTVMNGKSWIPEWPDLADNESRDQKTYSSKYDQLNPPLPAAPVSVKLRSIAARGKVRIVQTPMAENQYTLVVEFDDNRDSGAADYVVEISYAPAAK